ncbi:MAG TPA: alpha/beta fold hydrolase, partial [Rubrivivax sp.]|nr:alpha/beta fold hydrolase [Rubrivivax sp.]
RLLVLLTKADKLNRSEAQMALSTAQQALADMSSDTADIGVALFSALSKQGVDDAALALHGWAGKAGMSAAVRCWDEVLPGGITLACRGAGTGHPRVVLLHGFPEAAFIWDDVMQRLAARTATVAPNLRGYAGSSAPTEVAAYRPKALIGDVAALIQSIGAPIDLLVAHDWGGALAWGLAASRPELMKRLLIINSPHPATFLRDLRDDAAQQAASGYMNFLCRPDAEQLLAADDYARVFRFFNAPAWLTPAVRDQYRAVWAQGLTGPLNYYRASPLRPAVAPTDAINTLVLPDEAVTVRVPTTLLWGEQDKALLPGLLRGLERWVPQLDVQRVPDASHWLIHEQPDRVVDQILALLSP